ncbi:MAG TPA: ATP-binding protein [Actinomycetota bacterium]|nr:ATP-binding protein [Actinomycetota bacterium]
MSSESLSHISVGAGSPTTSHVVMRAWRAIVAWLPDGGLLPREHWARRHRAISWVLALQVVGLVLFGLARGETLLHALFEITVPVTALLVANQSVLSRALRSVAGAFGLIACSSILVHLSGGTIEAHFHFFVMLAVISLYQEWRAFLLAVAFVALHHGTVGIFDAASVYNHPAALADPWTWSMIHALMVLAECVALVAGWRFSEQSHGVALEAEQKRVEETEALLQANVEATEALRRREAQLRAAQSAAKLVSWQWDLETDEVETSDEALNLFGWDAPRTKLSDFIEMVHPDDREAREIAVRESLETLQPYSWTGRIVRASREIRHVVGAGSVIADEAGTPLRVVGTLQDVTEAKLLEAQLLQAQKMEAVGQLAGGIAHDFNNLLSVITNYARFVADEVGDDAAIQEDVAQIIDAGDRAAALTSQLLTFSRKDRSQPKVVALDEVVFQSHKLLARSIEENVTLSLKLNADPWKTLIDPVQVEQILMNLVINAKDAMPDGGDLLIETDRVSLVDVEGSLHPELKPGDYVRLRVSDTGAGMTLEIQKRIFDPFYTTKDVGKGTGLGLATLYGIAIAAGGSVKVYSEVGIGSTFSVYLPRVAVAEDAVTHAPEPGPVIHGAGARVLVVEDQEPVLRLTTRILRARGYEVVALSEPLAAVALVEESKADFDLLLTDVIMPGMSGPELAERLGLPAIFMSGYTAEHVGRQNLIGSAATVLHKPFTPDEVVQAVAQALGTVPSQHP